MQLFVTVGLILSIIGCKLDDDRISGSFGESDESLEAAGIKLSNGQFTLTGKGLKSITSAQIIDPTYGTLALDIVSQSSLSLVLQPQTSVEITGNSQVLLVLEHASGTFEIPVNTTVTPQASKSLLTTGMTDNASASTFNITTDNKLGIGQSTVSPSLQTAVAGKVAASSYCDEDGGNCFTASSALANVDPWITVTGGVNYAGGGVGIGTSSINREFDMGDGKFYVDVVGTSSITIVASNTNLASFRATDRTDEARFSYMAYDNAKDRAKIGAKSMFHISLDGGNTEEIYISGTHKLAVLDAFADATWEISHAGGTTRPSLFCSSTEAGDGNLFAVTSTGEVGIGVGASPAATVDVSGFIRMNRYGSAPVACSVNTDGSLAFTSNHRICVCKNGVGWIFTDDGSTACSW